MAPDVDVNRDSLLTQAKVWDAQSSAMGKILSEIEGTQQSSAARVKCVDQSLGDFFIFGDALGTYETVCMEYSRLVGDGQQEMQEIGDALIQSYQNYEKAEQVNARSASNAG